MVCLAETEREKLTIILKKGKRQAGVFRHSQVLLAVDANSPNNKDSKVAKTLRMHRNAIGNCRQRFVEMAPDFAIQRKNPITPSRRDSLDGQGEARLLTIACSTVPTGRRK